MKLLPQIELLLEILGSNHFPYNAMAQKFSAIVTSPLTSITVTFLCNYFKESVKCILKGNNFLFEGGQKKEKKTLLLFVDCRLYFIHILCICKDWHNSHNRWNLAPTWIAALDLVSCISNKRPWKKQYTMC